MSDLYSKFLIKQYKHWAIYLHQNQSYLGRCYVWCLREEALDLSEATQDEQAELFVVLNDLKDALAKTFKHDWLNYAFLGNETQHLHGHIIPRYAQPREFMGKIFEDKLWGHNYKTDPTFQISDEVLEGIKVKIKDRIVS